MPSSPSTSLGRRESLVAKFADGVPFAIVLGGQGTDPATRMAQLRGTHRDTIDADQLWAAALDRLAPVIGEVVPWWTSDLFRPTWWATPDEGMRTWAPARSVPEVTYTQLLELRSLHALDLDLERTPPTAVAGHSQGELAALAAAGHLAHEDALALSVLIGTAAQRAAQRRGLARRSDGPDGAPMVGVTGLTRDRLDELVEGAGPYARVVVAVSNASDRHVLAGPPEELAALHRSAAFRAAPGAGWDPLDVGAAYHHPDLAPAVEQVRDWADRCGLAVRWDEGRTRRPVVANDLGGQTAAELAGHVLVDHFDWPATIGRVADTSPEWLLDLGPDHAAGRLARPALVGRGVGIVVVEPASGVSAAFTPGAAPTPPPPAHSFAPGLARLGDGRVLVDNLLTRRTGQSPVILAGMTPTTVEAPIVAAAANAGYWAELAGGGQVTESILRERLRELRELLDAGTAVHVNTLHLDPYLWDLHLGSTGVLLDEIRSGAPVRGVTVSAGLPELDDAVALVGQLLESGVEDVAFKVGTADGIRRVVAIAQAVAPAPLCIHIEGGRAGGHHSWEDLDRLLLGAYDDLRSCPNLVVCVGGGIGTPAAAADYLDGSWALRHGAVRLPVDGVLVGTAAMACAEAATAPGVKARLAAVRGTDALIPAGSSRFGLASGRSQLGADLHELDNHASRVGRLLDEVAGDTEAVERRRDELVTALAGTAKPYFGDVATMTYAEMLQRYIDLCAIGRGGRYEDGTWLDRSWRRRFLDLLRRVEARLHPADHGPIPSEFGSDPSADDPAGALAALTARFPAATTARVHPADVHHFLAVCDEPGKPVPFVPVIDAEIRRRWRSDSLWQSHDDRYDPDGVLVIPGPVAVAGIDVADEPVAELLARFERAVVERLQREGRVPTVRHGRRGGPDDSHPASWALGEPAIDWQGRRRVHPARRIADAAAWTLRPDGTATAPGGRARLVPTSADTANLEIEIHRPGQQSERLTLELRAAMSPVRGATVTDEAATSWANDLAQVLEGPGLRPAASMEDHAALFGVDTPLPDAVVGRCWPGVFAALAPAVGTGFLDLVHLDHTVALLREVPGDDPVTVEITSTEVRDTAAGRLVTIEVAVGSSTAVAAELTERFLVRSIATPGEPLPPAHDHHEPSMPVARRTLAVDHAITPATGVAMATLTGDLNPLHTSPEVARLAGFDAPIVHGMWVSAAMQRAAVAAGGGRPRTWQTRFIAPVPHGTSLELTTVRTGRCRGGDVVEVTARLDGLVVAVATGALEAPPTVYAFPGQGIQRRGMGLDARSRSAAARAVWDRADRFTRSALGFSILAVVRDNPTVLAVDGTTFRHPDGVLHLTQFTQVAMSTLAAAQMAELSEAGCADRNAVVCGHSVGEYNALAAVSGILPLEGVLEIVYRRGTAMHRLVPRDSEGASRYRLAAARPSEAGLDEAGLVRLVDTISADVAADEFLQIVNYNLRDRQYAIAGTVGALALLEDELEALRRERGGRGVFVVIPGIDVPFHSSVLRPGVDEFRRHLDAVLPDRIDPELLVHRYIPNLVARWFTLDRSFAEAVSATVPSTAIADALADWDRWASRPAELCRLLLVELLAWQFASPVRWIETQDLLFECEPGRPGVRRFVEIGLGTQPTLTGLARQTLGSMPGHHGIDVLNIELDRGALFGEDADPPTGGDPADQSAPGTESHGPESHGTPATAPTTNGVHPPEAPVASTRTGPPSPAPGAPPWAADDGVRLLLSWWSGIRRDQLGPADTVESLCDGASSRRNQLLMDLGAEFGLGGIDGAAEATVAELVAAVAERAPRYDRPGPVLRALLDEQLRRLTGPALVGPGAVAERLGAAWGLDGDWAGAVAAHLVMGTRSGVSTRGGSLAWLEPTTPTDPATFGELVDHAVTDLAARLGIHIAPVGRAEGAALDGAAAAALVERLDRHEAALSDVVRALEDHLGKDSGASQQPAGAAAHLVAGLDDLFVDGTRPAFDPSRAVLLDDRWAGQREDLLRLAWTAPDDAAERDRLGARLSRGLDDGAREQLAHWRAADPDRDLADRLDTIAVGVADRSFADDVALVTGASPGSIAAAVSADLLGAGATVIATTSHLDPERLAWFRTLYHDHATAGAALWVAPANLASYEDVDSVVRWADAAADHPPVPTLLFPFAAPRVTGDLGDVGPARELEMRVLLWSIERTLAGLAAERRRIGRRDRLHVVLPGSPNRGRFGGDGAYGESKAAFDALTARAASEPRWGATVRLVHARIGWVRGTGLMGANDPLCAAVEAAGVRVWTAPEMAAELVDLCRQAYRSLDQPSIDVDLTGGLADADLDLRDLAARPVGNVDDDLDDPAATSTIPALPNLTTTPGTADGPVEWPATSLSPRDLVVIVGTGEVGPLGSSRTRWQVEVDGRLSASGVAELAWTCDLIRWEQNPRPGFVDVQSGEPVPEEELIDRYHDRVMAHSGIRVIADDGEMAAGTVPLLASVFLERDLTFTVRERVDADAFRSADPERTVVRARPDGGFDVTRRAGTEIRVPRRVALPRSVGAQLPDGFDPTAWGIPPDMVHSLDRVAVWNLVATVDAFLDAGIEPTELLGLVHPTEVGNTQGTGIGGVTAIRSLYVGSLLGESRANDTLQEALPNVVAAHVMQSYVGGYGPMVHPVAACATAAVSVEEAVDKIRAGRATVVVAGGFDDLGHEGVIGFADMSATADTAALAAAGVEAHRMSRPNDRRRAGFVEAQGGGTLLLARGDVALAAGLPVQGVVVWAGSSADGAQTSIPAPGVGLVGVARGGRRSGPALALAALGLEADDIGVASKHDTSTRANDPNESLVLERLLGSLGRTPSRPLAVVSQKSVTGHAKGGAAAFQLSGLCQILGSGTVPGNRSLDCVDPELARHGALVWPTRSIQAARRIRCGAVTSLGFGHVAALVMVAHPDAFLATVPAHELDGYRTRAAGRRADGIRRRLAAQYGGPALFRRTTASFGAASASEPEQEIALLVDGGAS